MAKIREFWFRVEIDLELTKAEVEHLMACSKAHYDYKCKQASEVGGFIYGWRNHFELDPETGDGPEATTSVRATWHEMDLACKILEVEQWHDSGDEIILSIAFRSILLNMKTESESVNAQALLRSAGLSS